MKSLSVVSDLHLEFLNPTARANRIKGILNTLNSGVFRSTPDTVIISGDLMNFNGVVHGEVEMLYALQSFGTVFKYVIFVPGNHEYYSSGKLSIRETRKKLENVFNNLPKDRYFLLDNKTVTINGQRYVGSTLWTNFYDVPQHILLCQQFNDFGQIRNSLDEITRENQTAVKFLTSTVQPGDVVVTHHMPNSDCSHALYANHPLNLFFYNTSRPLNDLVLRNQPKLWVFGHTHTYRDFKLANTRFVCNPYGYPDERTGFSGDLVVEF